MVKHICRRRRDVATHRVNGPSGQFSENLLENGKAQAKSQFVRRMTSAQNSSCRERLDSPRFGHCSQWIVAGWCWSVCLILILIPLPLLLDLLNLPFHPLLVSLYFSWGGGSLSSANTYCTNYHLMIHQCTLLQLMVFNWEKLIFALIPFRYHVSANVS